MHNIKGNFPNPQNGGDDDDDDSESTESTIKHIISTISSLQKHKLSSSPSSSSLPFVTLTYAQSLDGMIAISSSTTSSSSSNLPLSSQQSFIMTHALRSIHDAVLIGGNTFRVDNPRLTNRLWPTNHDNDDDDNYDNDHYRQPRAVIIDTELTNLKALLNQSNEDYNVIRAKKPIICCSFEASQQWNKNTNDKDDKIQEQPFILLPCKLNPQNSKLDMLHTLQQLYNKFKIQSIMVEGGSSILSSFLQLQLQKEQIIDCICVTICPRIIGNVCGLHSLQNFASGGIKMVELNNVSYCCLGVDVVLLATFK